MGKKCGPKNCLVCPLGGSKILLDPPQKKYGKKIASDPNLVFDKMIHCDLFGKKIGSKKMKTPEISPFKKNL